MLSFWEARGQTHSTISSFQLEHCLTLFFFRLSITLLISPLLPSVLSFNHSVTVSFINVSALDFVLAVFAVVIPSVKKKEKKIFDIPPVPPKVNLVVKATVFILRGILL